MNHKPLTQTALLKGKLGNFLNMMKNNDSKSFDGLSGYQLVRDITPIYSSTKGRVGIYKNKKKQDVVIKKCTYAFENLDAKYMKNEAYLLKKLTEVGGKNRLSPTFIEFIQKNNHVSLVTTFEKGVRLDTMAKDLQVDVIKKTFNRLQELSASFEKHNFFNLSVRKPLSYLLSFPINFVKLILKNPTEIGTYLKHSLLFYSNYLIGCFGGITLALTHRDLYPDNILYRENDDSITVLDWESAVVSDAVYDLSQIAMIYCTEFKIDGFLEFLNEHLDTNAERRRFIALSIFNSIQILGNNRTNDAVFKNTSKFLDILLKRITPAIMKKKSPFEIINTATMDMIALFYNVTRLPMHDSNKKIILCYHSIGNDGWRFSTKIKTFKSHLNFLKKHYALVNLPDLLSTKNGGINISFDDGYENVVTHALPLLKEAAATATIFVLGDGKNARRDVLNNNLPIMTEKQILYLRKNGWEIGYHTYTHPNLGTLHQTELNEEIVEGRKKLEKRLEGTLRYFAYPKGIYSKQILRSVREAGFEAAFTVDGSAVSLIDNDPLLLDRVPIEGELTAIQLGALISPIGLFMTKIFMRILSFKEKHVSSTVN